ncbi:MAG TPA: DNA internalization-related competence protein ComEC/Rec2 [Actinomycetota bacterium]|nr:DNA internalization-related competence protein ComEC/Rec2 [Actinomycetota bacterium]
MTAWLLPVLAAGACVGILLEGPVAERAPVAAWLLLSVMAFGSAILVAPGRGTRPRLPLDEDRRPEPAVQAVTPAELGVGRGPPSIVAALMLAGAVCVGLGVGAAHAHRVRDGVLAHLAPGRATVEAVLRIDPRSSLRGWWAIADARLVTSDQAVVRVREGVWVSGDADPPGAVRGDRIRVTGRVLVPEDPEFARSLERRGMATQLRADEIERLGPSDAAFVRWAQAFRRLVGGSILRRFPEPEAGLLLGLALGDDTRLDPALERDFRASGLSHLLVVSGGNVVMVLTPILALASLLRLSRWPRFAVGVTTVAFFVVVTGVEPSVLRAGVMVGLTLLGVLLGRPRSTAAILSSTVFVLVLWDPALVWSVAFQLSVAATSGLVAMATPLAARLRWVPRPVALATAATLGAQIAVTPVLLFHFGEVPVSTVVANVFAFPAVAPSLMVGLAAAFAALVWAPAGALLAQVALVPIRYLATVADVTAMAPLPWNTGGGAATLLLGLAVAGGLAWWLRSGARPPRRVLVLAVALIPFVVWATAVSSGPHSGLTVRFFDVGQGDAALLTSPGGVSMLVDGGPDEAQVARELAALGVKRLDVVVASHPHADHVVGLPTVLARFPVSLLLEPGCPTDSPDAAAIAQAIDDERVEVRHPRAGDRLVVGDVLLEILSPDRCWSGTESDTNNDALVVRASLGEDAILFATEPEEPAQQVLIDDDVDVTADVLKVPHHGAATSLEAFFQAVRAQVAVVSVGENTYGHPVPEVLEWIRATGAEVLRTDVAGTVTITFADGGLHVDSGG